jgi:hypothetical protein
MLVCLDDQHWADSGTAAALRALPSRLRALPIGPASMYLVNRIAAFDIEVDRSRLFDRDMSEMRLKARVDFAYPYPTAINRATAVPA